MTNNQLTDNKLTKIIESAEAVISALAGTNEDVHPDNSTEMCRLYDWLNDNDAPPEVVLAMARELQEHRKAVEPVYQYRIRNGYNGQVTEWQTIRRDQVDFVLKAQPHNAEFQIIAAPQPAKVVPHFDKWFEGVIRPAMQVNGIKSAEQRMAYGTAMMSWEACSAAMLATKQNGNENAE